MRASMQSNEPTSCHIPNNTATQSTFSGTASTLYKQCLKLDSEHKLLNDNERCVKCYHLSIKQCVATCSNDFPNPLTYCSITQNDANCAKHAHSREVATEISVARSHILSIIHLIEIFIVLV